MVEWIGFLAAFLTTACYVPQALHIIRSRKTDGISLMGYSLLTCGVALWFVYGIFRGDWPLMLANGCCMVLLSIILVMKVRLK